MMKGILEWHPTVFHDLHEAQSYLYVSTGTGPYNESLDPIQINEWWLLAETEVMEMAKRGVPGVWTYGFYDGWVPNYLFWMALTHNSFGRFYEVQSYGPAVQERSATARHHAPAGMVPPKSSATYHQMGSAQQHQYSGIRSTAGHAQSSNRQGTLSGKLLDEK